MFCRGSMLLRSLQKPVKTRNESVRGSPATVCVTLRRQETDTVHWRAPSDLIQQYFELNLNLIAFCAERHNEARLQQHVYALKGELIQGMGGLHTHHHPQPSGINLQGRHLSQATIAYLPILTRLPPVFPSPLVCSHSSGLQPDIINLRSSGQGREDHAMGSCTAHISQHT